MLKLLSLKNDFVFKKIFSQNTEILIDLINSVLRLPEESGIVSVTVKNPEILPDEIEKKFIILDVRAVDQSGNEYDIEIQVRRYENYPKRTLYYLCKMYGEQLSKGENYAELCPVIGIHFLDYEQFPDNPDFHYHFYLRDTRYPDLSLTDDISLHIFELPGIEYSIKHRDKMQEWMYFFNHAHEEGENTMEANYSNPMIKKAYDALQFLSADEKARDLAERREKALKDEAMFLEEARNLGMKEGFKKGEKEGKKEGKKEGRKETAINLLKMKLLTEEQIAQASGMNVKEIEKLKYELN
ncbi:Putative transposase, RpnA-like [Desulfonema limicola]|uniref:Transposase, RpnA-like n=1 Tax=Desulfonema limicola TaxID=45656 RepID=A0A975BB38_9BACT|nr:Rpn family recombination-promoting nuclease/putative transposase [Desulfonema limicola]QTA81935.1 Putative transposase, RpnA-like [Desulfonema limicola]